MIFSGSTAGGSGGRRSDLLPERSRRAAAARSWAAILMGLEMVAARRFAAPRGVLRRRREFSEQRCLGFLALVQGRAPYKCAALSGPMDRSKNKPPRCSTGKSGRVQCALAKAVLASVFTGR